MAIYWTTVLTASLFVVCLSEWVRCVAAPVISWSVLCSFYRVFRSVPQPQWQDVLLTQRLVSGTRSGLSHPGCSWPVIHIPQDQTPSFMGQSFLWPCGAQGRLWRLGSKRMLQGDYYYFIFKNLSWPRFFRGGSLWYGHARKWCYTANSFFFFFFLKLASVFQRRKSLIPLSSGRRWLPEIASC